MQLEQWQVLLLASMLAGSFFGLVKMYFSQFEKRQEERFKYVEASEIDMRNRIDRLERETLTRADWIRETVTMQRMMDRMQSSLDTLMRTVAEQKNRA